MFYVDFFAFLLDFTKTKYKQKGTKFSRFLWKCGCVSVCVYVYWTCDARRMNWQTWRDEMPNNTERPIIKFVQKAWALSSRDETNRMGQLESHIHTHTHTNYPPFLNSNTLWLQILVRVMRQKLDDSIGAQFLWLTWKQRDTFNKGGQWVCTCVYV